MPMRSHTRQARYLVKLGADQVRVPQTNLAMFAYIPLTESAHYRGANVDCHCLCCSEVVGPSMETPKNPNA